MSPHKDYLKQGVIARAGQNQYFKIFLLSDFLFKSDFLFSDVNLSLNRGYMIF